MLKYLSIESNLDNPASLKFFKGLLRNNAVCLRCGKLLISLSCPFPSLGEQRFWIAYLPM